MQRSNSELVDYYHDPRQSQVDLTTHMDIGRRDHLHKHKHGKEVDEKSQPNSIHDQQIYFQDAPKIGFDPSSVKVDMYMDHHRLDQVLCWNS